MKWQWFKFPELLLWLCVLVDFFDLLVNGNYAMNIRFYNDYVVTGYRGRLSHILFSAPVWDCVIISWFVHILARRFVDRTGYPGIL